MNIIKEALKFPKELRNFLEDVINDKDEMARYYGIKLVSMVIGQKGFEKSKIAAILPLIKVIQYDTLYSEH